ncbi:hypothetical protein LINPERHAP1_LOCUS30262, partial [Linum perenne]
HDPYSQDSSTINDNDRTAIGVLLELALLLLNLFSTENIFAPCGMLMMMKPSIYPPSQLKQSDKHKWRVCRC